MRRFVTGVNAAGRSCIVEEGEVTLGAVEGIAEVLTANLWATDASPPPAAPPQAGHFVDVRLPPGIVRWMVVEHTSHEETDTRGDIEHDAPHERDRSDLRRSTDPPNCSSTTTYATSGRATAW